MASKYNYSGNNSGGRLLRQREREFGGIISGVVANSREMFSDISGRGGIISAMPNSYKTSY